MIENLECEIWKDVFGYEGLYQVSNKGRVKSINNYHRKDCVILKPQLNRFGYEIVNLYRKRKMRHFFIHKLVAFAFIQNPNNYPQVNHKDECKTNNNVENLEWCTAKYNINYGTRNIRCSLKNKGQKGNVFWNNGVINVRARECPDGFVRGIKRK